MSADAASISRRRGFRLVARRWINLCAALVALLLSQGEFIPASHATTTLVTASTYNYDRTDANAQRASRSTAFASVRTIRLAPASTAHGPVRPRFAHFLAAESAPAIVRGGETAATAYGRAIHKTFDYGPGFRREFSLPSGRRADAVNLRTREVVELKPNNPRAIALGRRQLDRYASELEALYPGAPFTRRLETYDRP